MSLPWIDDSRSIANADASYSYTITQDSSSQAFLPVRTTRYGFALEGKNLGSFPDMASAKAACEADYANPT